MTCFDGVAIGSELDQLRNGLASAKSAHTKQIGASAFAWSKVTKIDLTNKPTQTPPRVPIVIYSVCLDVSKVNIVDYQGNSIVPPDRKPRSIQTIGVANYKYPQPGEWRVAYIKATGKAC